MEVISILVSSIIHCLYSDLLYQVKINMRKILYDKINKREARIQWFTDQDGNYWMDVDRFGQQMGGNVTIKFLTEDHPQYEIREIKI
jgi:hypothetical protein